MRSRTSWKESGTHQTSGKTVHEETIKVFQLQKQVTDLKQLTTLGQLTANLAHDLGTPLHSIAGLAKLLWKRAACRKTSNIN